MLQWLRTICDAVVATGVCYGPQKWAFWLEGSSEDKQSVVIAILIG